ncbi:MAG TPA: DUF5683 domain-containing protein [Bacteroidales bacterium]|nr:DUF5683 domain-containing protein [Bacteroidales bacterium]
MLLVVLTAANSYAQHDSIPDQDRRRAREVSPMKATMLAAALPGSGQVYNRKYWKIPFVYAGFGALGYSIVVNTDNYNEFLQAYIDITDDIPETNSYTKLTSDFEPETIDPALGSDQYDPKTSEWIKSQIMNGIDYYRRYRDLSYIGVAVWYLITILDANIDANMYDYDIGDDLNISIKPVPIATDHFKTAGLGITVTF